MLIEHHAGKFPLWLAPVQARVLPITEAQNDYATRVAATLAEAGLRVETDLGSDKVGSKIRQATLERIPFMLVVGAREAEAGAVSVRERTGQDHGVMPVAGFLDKARARIAERT